MIANRISYEKTLSQTILDSGIYGHERAFARLNDVVEEWINI